MTTDMDARYSSALAEGRIIVDSEPRSNSLFDLILPHLPLLQMNRGPLDIDPEIDDLVGRKALVADMHAHGFIDWGDRLQSRQVRVRLMGNASDAAVDFLMGGAAGRYFAENITQSTISVIDNVLMAFPDGWREFSKKASHCVGGDLNRNRELLRFLLDKVRTFEQRVTDEIVPRHRRYEKQLIESYKSAPKLRNVWHEQPHDAMIRTDDVLFFDVLRRCNPIEFLKLIDAFSHPQVGRNILHFVDRVCSFDEMLGLFKISPVAFDLEGIWNENIKTPILLLQALGRKLAHIAISNDVAKIGTPEAQPSEAFKSAVHSIFEALAARVDREDIGFSWLEYLVDLQGMEFRQQAGQDERLPLCYHYLITELAKNLSPHSSAISWIEAQEAPWRYSRAVTTLAVAALGKGGGTTLVKGLVEAILHRNFLSTGSMGQFIAPGRTPQRLLVGLSLSGIGDISAFFTSLWKSLSQLRDRSRHLESIRYEKAGVADELLISWFLCAAEFLNPDHTEARSLWLSLFGAIREVALTQMGAGEDLLSTQYKFLAGLLALRLALPENDMARQDFDKLSSLFAWPDPNLPRILIMLRDMGTPASVMRSTISNLPRVIELLKKFVRDDIETQLRFDEAHVKRKESLGKRVELIIAELDEIDAP